MESIQNWPISRRDDIIPVMVTTIVVADDHEIVRESVSAFLGSDSDIKVVGTARDGLEAMEMVERLKPDALVLDLMMGGISAVDTIRHVVKKSPKTVVVVFSMWGNEEYVLTALRAGAKGYVLKECPPSELIRAINEARAGRHYLAPAISERVIDRYLSTSPDEPADPYETLTKRERTILGLMLDGITSPGIAKRLFISPRTVEVHRTNLMKKLGLHNRTDVIRWAAQRNMLPPLAAPPSQTLQTSDPANKEAGRDD